ncbi:MAG: MFS transporter [Nocardioidaceae bacterium]
MRLVWRLLREQRDFRFVLGAGLVSLTGDWILRVGLAYYVYALTGSTLISAALLLASFLPQVLLGSLAGVFVDRWDRKRTMITTNLLLGAGLLPLLLVTSAGQVWVITVVMAWEGCVQQFFLPAEQSLLPRLIPDERLLTANALNGQNRDLSRLIGSALGGVVTAVGGIAALALVDVASFVLSAGLITLVRTAGRVAISVAKEGVAQSLGQRVTALRDEWFDGLRLCVRGRILRALLLFVFVTSTGEGIMGTLFAPFVRQVLHGSSTAYGVIVSVQAIGGIVGGLVAASLGSKASAVHLFGWGSVCFGAIDLAMFLYPLWWATAWPAGVCMVVVGVPGALTVAGLMTLFQRNTADPHRGRVFGAIGGVEGVAVVVGTVSAGLLGQAVGIIPVLAFQGGGYVVAGLAMLVLLRAGSGELDEPARSLSSPRSAGDIDVPTANR